DVGIGDNGVPVPEFGGVFHFDGNARVFFNKVFAHQRRVPRGAAGDDDDATGLFQCFVIIFKSPELYLAFRGIDAAPHTVAHGYGLLVNFLQHKVIVARLLQHFQLELQFVNGRGLDLVVDCFDFNAVACDGRNFQVLQVDDMLCVFDNRGRIGSDDIFSFADADDHRTPFAGGDQLVRVFPVDNDNGVSAD